MCDLSTLQGLGVTLGSQKRAKRALGMTGFVGGPKPKF